MIDLMFINLYGTILPENREPILRDGFLEFLDRYKSIRVAICTYVSEEIAVQDLILVGLINKVEQIYTLENMNRVRVYNKERNDIKNGYLQPNLRTWARGDFHTSEDNSIIISNNALDIIAADWYNVKLVEIPVFKDEHDTFSFDDVSVGSWYYDIRYFIHRLKGKQMKISLKAKNEKSGKMEI